MEFLLISNSLESNDCFGTAHQSKCPQMPLCLDWIKAIASIIEVPLTIWSYTPLLPCIAQPFPITQVSITCRAG